MKWNTYGPRLWFSDSICYEIQSGAQAEIEPGRWMPARPVSGASLLQRFRYAWLVFTGRADVLYWPKQEHTE